MEESLAENRPHRGRVLTYHCTADSSDLVDSRPTTTTVSCGLGAPLGPRLPPFTPPEEFGEPRNYATAMTVYALTSAKTKVLSRPDCGDRVTWMTWSCAAKARSEIGPFAGLSLVYRCTGNSNEQPGHQPLASDITCGPANPPPLNGIP